MDHTEQEQVALHRWPVIAEAAGETLRADRVQEIQDAAKLTLLAAARNDGEREFCAGYNRGERSPRRAGSAEGARCRCRGCR